MERFKKSAVHCIFTVFVVCFVFGIHAQGIVGTTSENGVNIIWKDNLNNTLANKFDLTGSPRDLTKWTFGAIPSVTLSDAPTMATNAWFGTPLGFEEGSTHFIRLHVNANRGCYLWTPELTLPNVSKLMMRITIRHINNSNTGIANNDANGFSFGAAFDSNNDQIPDATPSTMSTIFPNVAGTAGPYNDFFNGGHYTTGMHFTRTLFFHLDGYENRTGRIGIQLRNFASFSRYFQIDYCVIATEPSNDLCNDAYSLSNGVNGGTNGFYNTSASGLIPSVNHGTGPPDSRTFIGGAVTHIGSGTNGIGSIPKDVGGVVDGYAPSNTTNQGSFSLSANTVESSTWYKVQTPLSSDCTLGTLTLRFTIRNLSCASQRNNFPNQLQFRMFNNSTCGTTTNAATVQIAAMQSLNNNGAWTTPGLSFNTTYYILVDPVGANDCRFQIEVETLIGGVVQTGDCVVLPITLKSFNATPEEDCTVNLNWATLSERNNDFFTIERSTDGVNYIEIHKQAGAGNSTSELTYGAVDFLPEPGLNYYRLKQTDFDGNFEYFEPVAVNVIPAMLNMTLIPNPTSRDASVLLSSRSRQQIRIEVIDLTGKQLYQIAEYINEGNTSFALPSETWNSGTYIVRVVTDKETLTEKLIVNL